MFFSTHIVLIGFIHRTFSLIAYAWTNQLLYGSGATLLTSAQPNKANCASNSCNHVMDCKTTQNFDSYYMIQKWVVIILVHTIF